MPDKYRLLKDLPVPSTTQNGYILPFGTIFEDAPFNMMRCRQGWGFPKKAIKELTDWFEKVEERQSDNSLNYYTEDEMRKCYERGWMCGAVSSTGRYDKEFCSFETFIKELNK